MLKKTRRILAIVMAAVLVLCGMPMVAGAAELEYNGLKYEVMEDGNVTITGYNHDIELGDLTIPSTIEGRKVTEIGESAFIGCNNLTNVTIPNSVTSIGFFAFRSCDGLESVTIPNSVTTIGNCAFCGCDGLKSVTISGSELSIAHEAFYGCRNLTSVTIKSGVKSIEAEAFGYCVNLQNVTISNGVKSINDCAFVECYSLANITIPESVEVIERCAFSECYELKSVTIQSKTVTIKEDAIPNARTVIYGYEGSTAQAWAEKYDRQFVSLGEYVPTETNTDGKTGITASYDKDSFEGDVEFNVTEDAIGIKLLDKTYGKTVSWDINFSVDGKEVQPSKPVYVKIPIPEGFNRNMIAVYHINTATGKPERMDITIEGDYICFYATSFSPYVIVDESTAQTEPEPTDPSANCSCNCHKGGFMGFIWKIINFFNKLFRSKQYCACGAKHW